MIAGQFLDVSVQARGRADVDTAMTVLRYKSAKYSIERPLHIGAAPGRRRPHASIEQLTRFGLPLGEAFQLRDDLLGVFGDPEVTGKPAGDDLVEGKRTVLVALALDAAARARRERLDAALGTPLDAADVDELRAHHRRLRRPRPGRGGHRLARRPRRRRARRGRRRRARARRAHRAGRRRHPAHRLTVTATGARATSWTTVPHGDRSSPPIAAQSRLVIPGTAGPSPRSSTENGTPRSALTREPRTLSAMLKAFSSARARVAQPSHSRTTPSAPLPMSWRQSARASKFWP